MDDYSDLFDGPINAEVPELTVKPDDTFLLNVEDETYIVSVETVIGKQKTSIFAPVVYYNNIPQYYPVDFVSESRGRLIKFLHHFNIPYDDILRKVDKF